MVATKFWWWITNLRLYVIYVEYQSSRPVADIQWYWKPNNQRLCNTIFYGQSFGNHKLLCL